MKILKYKKIGLNKYKIFFSDSELIVHENIILKYKLLIKKQISIEDLESIIEDNRYYDIYSVALKYISIKQRTKKELLSYLIKKDFDENTVNKVLLNIEEQGYLNEKEYITCYINDQIILKNNGPYKIKESLVNLGIEESLVQEHLSKIDCNIWIDKIQKYVDKQIKINKKYSDNMLKQKMLNDLYNKGYEKNMIFEILQSTNTDDKENLIKEYQKAYIKYSKKYKDSTLDNKIVSYLMAKGYEYYKIKEQIKKLD